MTKQSQKKTSSSILLYATFLVAIIALGLSIYLLIQNGKSKIAFIDTAKVLKAYKGIEDLSKSLEEKNVLFKARLDTLVNEFQTGLMEFEKKRASLSQKELQEEENKLRRKQKNYEDFNASSREGLKQEEMKIIQKALDRINDKITRHAKSQGYAAVMGTTPNGTVLYVGEFVDITDEIINLVND